MKFKKRKRVYESENPTAKNHKTYFDDIVGRNDYYAEVLNTWGRYFPLYKSIMQNHDDLRKFRIGKVTVQLESTMNDPNCICFRPYASYESSNLEIKRAKEIKRLDSMASTYLEEVPIRYPEDDFNAFKGYTLLKKNGNTILDVVELGIQLVINKHGYLCNARGMKDQRMQYMCYEKENNSNVHLKEHDIIQMNIMYRSGISLTVWYYADDPVYSYYVLHSGERSR